jgi:mono/diheme cytochrome c family protein
MKMKKAYKQFISLSCVMVLALLINVSAGFADEIEKLTGRTFARLATGGILYDNWPEEFGITIDKTHPAYPAEGKKKGGSTWRCKECHGWDYKGAAGAYSKGSHFTGITGIRAYANQNPEDIKRILKNDTHALGDMITEDALEELSLFVAYGQIDTDLYINRTSKKSIGDPANGGRIFLATCIKCHGDDGKEINFKTPEKPEYIGTVANENPWETLHKIRWGHPGSQMISLLFLGLKEQLDVLAFCQTLPGE